MEVIKSWFRRHFSDPQVVILAVLLIGGFAVILFMGQMLAPVLASIVLAYLLESMVAKLQGVGMPRPVAVVLVFMSFMALLVFIIFGLLPILSGQVTQLVQQLPGMVQKGQALMMRLPEVYPNYIDESQVREIMARLRSELADIGQRVVSLSLSSVVGLIALIVYLVLMPLLVFFFLKDKDKILAWARGFFPSNIGLAMRVWTEVDRQIGNYVRGKMLEILIIWVASYITFALFGLQFALLLAALVGLSVIIPYIGAVVVTIPVALIAYFQWGWGADFAYLVVAYLIIQALDGNVIVPLLFSEAVNLHPIAIIVAILVFGGIWGFWGVFFAIPLATLVQAVLQAWPRKRLDEPEAREEQVVSNSADS